MCQSGCRARTWQPLQLAKKSSSQSKWLLYPGKHLHGTECTKQVTVRGNV